MICECGNKKEKSHTLLNKTIVYKNTCRTCRGRKLNKVKLNEYNKQWIRKNKEYLASYKKKWQGENKDRLNEYKKKWILKQIEKGPAFRIVKNLRSRLNNAIKGNYKSGSAVSDLGCSIEDFKKHLESKFTEGMSWGNYGVKGWHIDHIKPLARFDLENPEEFKRVCHYTNLQPLWAKDNLSKGAKV